MTCNVLVVGHIRLLEKLEAKRHDIVVGLLTSKALKGYKKELMSFKDRKYILETLSLPIKIVPQETLNPSKNLKKYKCTALVSGDGFEQVEINACKKLGVKLLQIKSGEKLHSSHIR